MQAHYVVWSLKIESLLYVDGGPVLKLEGGYIKLPMLA
jgi:hypothetical protein